MKEYKAVPGAFRIIQGDFIESSLSWEPHKSPLMAFALLATTANQLFPSVCWKDGFPEGSRHPAQHRCFQGSYSWAWSFLLLLPLMKPTRYGQRNEKCSLGDFDYKLVKGGENSLKSQRLQFKCACRSIFLSIKCFWSPIKQSTERDGMALNNLCTR